MSEHEHGGSVVKMVRPGVGSLDRARLLVENLLRTHGLDPERHLLSEGEDSCSWFFGAGAPPGEKGRPENTLLVMSVFMARGMGYFRVSAPIVFLPSEERLTAFYRRLLDLNSEMVSAALATFRKEVHVVSVRPVQDLDGSEVEDIIRSVTGWANMLKESLPGEFGARPWDLAGGPGRRDDEAGDEPVE